MNEPDLNEPDWKRRAIAAYAEKDAERQGQEQEAQRQQGLKLSKVLNEMLGLSVEASSERIEVSGVRFALGKNRAGLPAAFFVSACPYCGGEQLDEIKDPATLGMYLSGRTGVHSCPQAQEAARQAGKTDGEDTPEKRLVAALREVLLRPSY